jgi:hypothetical protein
VTSAKLPWVRVRENELLLDVFHLHQHIPTVQPDTFVMIVIRRSTSNVIVVFALPIPRYLMIKTGYIIVKG